jgi:two-component system phosphate regulon sensor histidine kinase PhoR
MIAKRFHRRLLAVAAAIALPLLGVFASLWLSDTIRFWPFILGWLGSSALVLVVLLPLVMDVQALSAHLRELGRDEDHPPVLHGGLANDLLGTLTQLKRGWKAKLDEAEARVEFQETLFESLPPPLFLLSAQRKVLRANLAARRIFGRELAGRDLAAILRNPPLLDAAELVLAGQPGREVEFSLPGPEEREFRAMLEPLPPQEGIEGVAAIVTLHDVTALRQMERMRADFVANASHELRTPLAAVLGFIETLQGPARDDAEARERFLSIMYDQASRMSRLVADLLNLSRIEMNEHSRPVQRTTLGPILERVVAGLEPQSRQRNMALELDVQAGLPEIIGQEDELTQVFQNLLENALKYGREGTAVEVVATVTGKLPPPLAGKMAQAIRVEVRDHGEGIEREHIPRLTERFFRVDTARSRRLGGTGLGLAIVKHVINRHRGALTIESTIGQGSCFTVFLPLAQ